MKTKEEELKEDIKRYSKLIEKDIQNGTTLQTNQIESKAFAHILDFEKAQSELEGYTLALKEVREKLKEDIKWYESYEIDGEKDKDILQQAQAIVRHSKELLSQIDDSPLSNVQERNSEKVVPLKSKIEDTKEKSLCKNCGKKENSHPVRRNNGKEYLCEKYEEAQAKEKEDLK